MLMQGHDLGNMRNIIVDESVDLGAADTIIQSLPQFCKPTSNNTDVAEFHRQQQANWHMPDHYKNLDIAAHVLNLCDNQAELQRCGQELLLFQERNLFDMLRYLAYLVDVMKTNGVIWGVGRGSSVASFVLYKLGVHRIDSLYYDLDPGEFLR